MEDRLRIKVSLFYPRLIVFEIISFSKQTDKTSLKVIFFLTISNQLSIFLITMEVSGIRRAKDQWNTTN